MNNKEQKAETSTEAAIVDNTMLGDMLFVPQIVMSWKTLNVDHFGVKIPINTEAGMGKYWMPVFENEEDCKREYPQCEVVILKRG